MKMKIAVSVVVGALAGVSLFHLSTPYLFLYKAEKTLKEGSRSEIKSYLQDHVDFEGVRESVRAQMQNSVHNELKNELRGNPFGGLAHALATSVINTVIDNTITPSELAGADFSEFDSSDCQIDNYSFGKALITCDKITFSVERKGFTWTLTGVEIREFDRELRNFMRGLQ